MRARRRTLEHLIRRRSDGTLWRPSYPSDWTDADAIAALFRRDAPRWYFRRVELVRRLILPDYWQDTGEVWEPERGREFDVLKDTASVRRCVA